MFRISAVVPLSATDTPPPPFSSQARTPERDSNSSSTTCDATPVASRSSSQSFMADGAVFAGLHTLNAR
jgi:hypothetical protein